MTLMHLLILDFSQKYNYIEKRTSLLRGDVNYGQKSFNN